MECKYESATQNLLKIGEIPATLVTWIPLVDHKIQDWISETIFDMFKGSTANKVIGTEAGITTIIIQLIGFEKKFFFKFSN